MVLLYLGYISYYEIKFSRFQDVSIINFVRYSWIAQCITYVFSLVKETILNCICACKNVTGMLTDIIYLFIYLFIYYSFINSFIYCLRMAYEMYWYRCLTFFKTIIQVLSLITQVLSLPHFVVGLGTWWTRSFNHIKQ